MNLVRNPAKELGRNELRRPRTTKDSAGLSTRESIPSQLLFLPGSSVLLPQSCRSSEQPARSHATRQHDTIRDIVALHMREILAAVAPQLPAAGVAFTAHEETKPVVDMRAPSSPEAVPSRRSRIVLDASCAVRLEGGSLVLSATKGMHPARWTILARSELRIHPLLVEYVLRGSISASLGCAEFVTRAYDLILDRPADSAGKSNYIEFLRRTRHGQQELLNILAASEEARKLERQLLMIARCDGDHADLALGLHEDGNPYSVLIASPTI